MPAKIQDVHIVAPVVPFKTAYGRHDRVTFTCDPVSLTHQSMADECDINRIMLKWQKTGVIEHVKEYPGGYGDFTNAPDDYQQSMNTVIEADNMFMTLPSSIRKRFHNDPAAFLDFVANPKNREELERLGLATAPPVDLIDVNPPTPPLNPDEPPLPLKTPPADSK